MASGFSCQNQGRILVFRPLTYSGPPSGSNQEVIKKTSFKHPADIQKSSKITIAIHFHFNFAQMLYEFLCFEVALTSEDNMAELKVSKSQNLVSSILPKNKQSSLS